MADHMTRVLLILPQSVLDRARVLAGSATSTLKLPVSLQIVLRVLIERGLKRDGDRQLLASIEHQARAVRRIRSLAGKASQAAKRQHRDRGSRRKRVRALGRNGRPG